MKDTEDPDPDAGTLPVPVQPRSTCRVPSTVVGTVALAVTGSPQECEWAPTDGVTVPNALDTESESFRSVIVATMCRGLSAVTESVVPSSVTPSATSPESAMSKRCVDGTSPIVSVLPFRTHFGAKSVDPSPVTATSIQTFVTHFHSIEESRVIVNETFDLVPLAGTLPVPVQPVQTICTPAVSGGGATALAAIESPQECEWTPGAGVTVPADVATVSETFRSVIVTRIVRGPSAGMTSVDPEIVTPSVSPESATS